MNYEVYHIPSNFTDAGRIMGLFELRNLVEAVILTVPALYLCMCNCSFRHENFDFMVRENVILVVQRYGEKKLQMSWKMMSMW